MTGLQGRACCHADKCSPVMSRCCQETDENIDLDTFSLKYAQVQDATRGHVGASQ
jgi:hypothetical protein